jgi:YegS/Rv2252/BmrU family lipid kinase
MVGMQGEIVESESSKKVKKMRYLFLLNPIAGVGERRSFLQLIEDACRMKDVECQILFTRSPGDARKIIWKRLGKFDVFVAVGGDGTMNEVGSALAGTGATMGLIPAGSGNALGRELGISMKPQMAINQLLNGKMIKIDTGIANGRRFMNVCGLGFDDHVARCFAKSINRGKLPYIKAVFKEFFSYNPENYEVECEGTVSSHKAFVLTTANTAQYGNNAFIAPGASISDGVLNFCVIKPFGFFAALVLGFRLFGKTIDHSRFYSSFETRSLVIRGKKLDFHVDGEPVSNSEPLVITIDPLSLNVIAP